MASVPFQAPTDREILKWNRALPDKLRQCSVVLRFKKVMPKRLTEHFYRVRMTKNMFSLGENDFWIPEIIQPSRSGDQVCLACTYKMKRVGVMSTMCMNSMCKQHGRTFINGPQRGIHTVKTKFTSTHPDTGKLVDVDFLHGIEWVTVEHSVWLGMVVSKLRKKGVDTGTMSEELLVESGKRILSLREDRVPMELVEGCLVVLDRRYSEQCLCAVWRTCGALF